MHRLHDEALYEHRRRDIRKTHLLLARRCGGRPRRCLPARDALLRFQFFRGLPRAGHAAVLRGLPPRPHAEPLHRVQPAHEVRRALPPRRGARLRKDRHRPLCAHRPCGGEIHSPKGARRDEGPELCALCHDAAGACAHALPAGGHAQERDARHRRDAGLRQRAQKGQPGHLLCPGRRLCRRHRAADGGKERSRRIRLDGRARSRRA